MRAVVTGGHGFVGQHLTAHLRALGDAVAILDRNGADAVDIVDADSVERWIATVQPDVVYHLAARSHVGASWNDEEAVQQVNVGGTANVLAASSAAGVARIVVVGSAEQYGRIDDSALPVRETTPLRPVSPYARSKVAAEELALAAQRNGALDVICVRAFNHTGPGQSANFLVPGLASRIAAAERTQADDIVVGNLDSVRDYTDVRDVVRAYRLLAERGEPGQVYNVCSGNGVTVADIAGDLLARARRPLRLAVDPELVRPIDVPVLVGDATCLREATGWTRQIPLERTLADVLDAARAAPG
jgi:GDP-4-dehydro-6-deoxy-D-mannose reductase